MVQISDRGYWIGTELPHGVDENLAKGLVKFFEKQEPDLLLSKNGTRTIQDFGCGNGFYTRELNKSSLLYCEGFDGNPNTKEISLDPEHCSVMDLTKEHAYNGISGWSLSLEVGEHIPVEYEQIFLDNVTNACLVGVVLSWSIPEYGGDGHVNSRPNEYIISEMEKRGFTFDKESTDYLRSFPAEFPEPCYWFRSTIMVFLRSKTDVN